MLFPKKNEVKQHVTFLYIKGVNGIIYAVGLNDPYIL